MNESTIEAITERAAIIEEGCGISPYYANRLAADLYHLTMEERNKVFPLPRRAGFEAVQYMASNGFLFLPWDDKEGRPALKWKDSNRKNFTNDHDKLLSWRSQGFKRFLYLPGLTGYIGMDIDVNHADGADGLTGFYEIMLNLAGKNPDRLPHYLRDLPNNFPCYIESPSGGLHLLFKYSGPCTIANLICGVQNAA
jgi:hypothetical protein